jgi:hypothetical protein
MCKSLVFLLLSLSALTINAQNINLYGKITNTDGNAIPSAVVELVKKGLRDTTGENGVYSFNSVGVIHLSGIFNSIQQMSVSQGVLELTFSDPSPLYVAIFDVNGNLLKKEVTSQAPVGIYRINISQSIATRILMIRVATGQRTMTFRYIPLNNGKYQITPSALDVSQMCGRSANIALVIDSLKVSATGYVTKVEALTSLEQEKNVILEAEGGESPYHTLPDWSSSEMTNKNHHGRMYFIANGQKDDQGVSCTECHGTNFEGSESAPACADCHENWKSCDFCHGTSSSKYSPPPGVFDESATTTLAVGRHKAHLSAGSSHPAFDCKTCHTVPVANDLTHTISYKPSADLTTPGHHGDVKFSGFAATTNWNVNATTGNPVSARGTCNGTCHSNGRGGNPSSVAYWAGGAWTSRCTNCHGATGSTRGSEHGHGFPGSNCGDCHDGASSTSYSSPKHMNGVRDFKTSPGGRASGMRLTSGWNCSNVSCHEEDD